MTDRQQQILDFIESEAIANGYPPTVREIGEAVGLRSTASVHDQLNKLIRLGLLSRAPGKVRAIRVVSRSLNSRSLPSKFRDTVGPFNPRQKPEKEL